MVETYYPSNRDKINKIFDGQKGNLSRYGSAAYEMAQVATCKAVAFKKLPQTMSSAGVFI